MQPSDIKPGLEPLLASAALIKDLAHRLPSELSGGEQQRVAIARALTNLTQHSKTVFYVTHALVVPAGACIDLLDGQIVEQQNTQRMPGCSLLQGGLQ